MSYILAISSFIFFIWTAFSFWFS